MVEMIKAIVARIPNCDFCSEKGVSRKAYADAKTYAGPWAYMCHEHFRLNNARLGMGHGQILVKG